MTETDGLRQVTDDLAIRNLVAHLAHLADQCGPDDLDEYINLFTDDASWGPPGQELRGRDEILRGARERRANGQQGPGANNRHIITTQSVRFDDTDTAVSDSYFVIASEINTSPTLRLVGAYHDTFRREDAGWKLASREVTMG